MPLVASPIPNLIGGVSQQPQVLRLPTSCAESINAWPSVVTGNNKRPPTEWIANLPITIDRGAIGYLIDRENDYRYIVVVYNGGLKVYDLSGVEQTVTFPDGVAYLGQAINPLDSFRFLTVGDTTFILNREVVAQSDEFGEIGLDNVSLAGTVATVGALPASSTLGFIYKVTSPLSYYQWTNVPAKSAVVAWSTQGSWTTINPGYTTYDTLPTVATAGTYIQLRKLEAYTYTERIGGGSDGGSYDVTRTDYRYIYQAYLGITVTPAVSSYNYWRQLTVNEISRTVNNRIDPVSMGTVHVTQTLANTYYSVYINGVLKASFLTGNGVTVAAEGTDQIANNLSVSLTSAGYPNVRYGSTISLYSLLSTDKISVTAGQGDKAIKCYRSDVDSFQALPPNEVQGRVVKIRGDVKSNGDDYYVVYQNGIWEETYGFNTGAKPEALTMPHKLVRNSDGTWTFSKHSWTARSSGDLLSNPNPSFINAKINDIFFYSGRLGLLADENVCLSEANVFENFYRTSLATLVDSDRLDYAVFNQGVDVLRHAIPFDKDLLLMSDKAQFRFTYQNYLGPKNTQVLFSTTFLVSPYVKPITIGNSIYFLDDKPEYTYAKVFEYFPKENKVGDDADDATAPIPQYIKSGIGFMSGSPRLHALLLHSRNASDTMYLYKFFWSGQNKIQNAWFKWQFPDVQQIYWADFSKNYIYLILKRTNGVTLERIRMDEKVYEPGRYVIDQQVQKEKLTFSYNIFNDITTITLPYSSPNTLDFVGSKTGVDAETSYLDIRFDATRVNATTYTVSGDLTTYDRVTAGLPYTFSHTFNQFFVRDKNQNGSPANLDVDRLQLKYMTLKYVDTAYFTTKLEYPGRDVITGVFESKLIGNPISTLGKTLFHEGVHRIPLVGNSQEIKLTIENDSPYPSSIASAEIFMIYAPKAKMRM